MTLASDARAIARAGVRAVDPAVAVRRAVARRAGGLRVGARRLAPGAGGRFHVIAIGKAAGAMADAAARLAGADRLGLAIPPKGYPAPSSGIPVRFGEHPLPGAGSFRAGAALRALVRAVEPNDAVLFLISGGGSAVAEAAVPPLSDHAVRATTGVLLASGAPIAAMNAVRRHLSRIKGGRLAEALPAAFATVAISDVVGDAPADIASGPTVPDPSTFADALAVVDRFALRARLPTPVVSFLDAGRAGRFAETPKPGAMIGRRPFVLAATNAVAVSAAVEAARGRGYRTSRLYRPVVGETQPAAHRFARRLVHLARRSHGAVALIGGGETTVTLGPRPGRGGRNQEFALASALDLAGHRASLVLSFGTDGIDGPTDAAGGFSDDRTLARSAGRRLDLAATLQRHAAYDALDALGQLWRTGPTGTNVTDLHVGLARPAVNPSRAGSSRRSAVPSSRRRRS
ncbi:MAG TPA: DUF4147 domain-containing protein [Thermoplasmata archaeon]|nr:DUF4147 domain-containing protein [Thermoplasmata archaeon]